MSDTRQNGVPGQTPEQLEADIERQRSDLAATITALEHRLDLKARAKDRLLTSSGKPRPEVLAVALLTVAAVLGLVIRRTRH